MCSDDDGTYDSAISNMKYKYLCRKELLLGRHQDVEPLKKSHREGYCLFDGVQRERVNTFVLECTHKNPNYLYSKQIWYVDPEYWQILYSDKFDKHGELWRVFDKAGRIVKSVYNDAMLGNYVFMSIIDVKRLHATGGINEVTIGERGEYFQPEYYTPKALQKYGY